MATEPLRRMTSERPVIVSTHDTGHWPGCHAAAKLKGPRTAMARIVIYRRVARFDDGTETYIGAASCCGKYLDVKRVEDVVWRYSEDEYG